MHKRGIYQPLRLYFSTTTAVMCTFLASGLFHEWILTILFYIHKKDRDENGYCSSCFYPHTYGKNLMFFLWNGVLIGVQFVLVKKFSIFSRLEKKLSPLIITFLVLMCGLPVGHWFLGDIVKARHLHQSQLILPVFVILDGQRK